MKRKKQKIKPKKKIKQLPNETIRIRNKLWGAIDVDQFGVTMKDGRYVFFSHLSGTAIVCDTIGFEGSGYED